MPTNALQDIISRALTDASYRQQLLDSLEDAIQGYELEDNERKMLSNLKADAFDDLDVDLEDRQSKSGLSMGLGSLMGGRDVSTGNVGNLINVLMNKYG